MSDRVTDELQNELMATPDLRRFLADNKEVFEPRDFTERLTRLLEQSGLSKAALARSSGMSEVYLYQIFGGRTPSRDRILCLCFALSAGPEETQALLKSGGHAPLYARNRRDAILLYGLNNGLTLSQVSEQLFEQQEQPLF